MEGKDYPLRHLSVRVPWHDSGWTGKVCEAPQLNGACAKLKKIAAGKKEEVEIHNAGMSFKQLRRDQWPCCVDERATFMAPFEMEQEKRHAMAEKNPKHHGHFLPTRQRYPAYSAGVVPFLWMMRDKLEEYGGKLDLDVDVSREPDLGYQTNWVHDVQNQRALLDVFAAHLRCSDSLCLFYAKHVPFVERTDRILIGAGRVCDIGSLSEYDRSGDGLRSMIWERPIQHSIRPSGDDGFLMPYTDILKRAEEDSSIDVELYAAFAPPEHWDEFSYASELVSHDGTISGLLSMESALGRIEDDLGIPTIDQRQWIHDELVRLWKVRGPFPGLGAILHALGLSRGLFVAHALQQSAGENVDPWPKVDAVFRDPTDLPADLQRDIKECVPTWRSLPEPRRELLRLLSRFELDVDQARCLYDEESRRKKKWFATDSDILRNPYRLFEISLHDPAPIHLLTVDRGVFPDDAVRALHPLEAPSRLDSAVDPRRVRAFTISALENASSEGHTLQSAGDLVEAIGKAAVRPECPVTSDILNASAADMEPEIVALHAEDALSLQLARYRTIGELVRKNVRGRVAGKRHLLDCDWVGLLGEQFGHASGDEESRAREEKAAALRELAESRFSVLAGPAGTGKTSILGILCAQEEIQRDGLLLLAPTGKARVRMQQLAAGVDNRAMTIAQFLHKNGRYDGYSGRYHLSDRPKATAYGTIIIDEASMLTEDMLGALLDALQGVKRLILCGDPAQLPPIGAGRPFVDIIAQLRPDDYEARFPRVTPGCAELTIERRQMGAERPDLRLARWFSAEPPSPGEDDVFTTGDREHQTLRFVEWSKPEDFRTRLTDVLTEELELEADDDQRGFNRAMGSTANGDYDYFNATRNGRIGAAAKVEAWQILTPLRGMPFGVGEINRRIHERFRAGFMELASRPPWSRPIPKPVGAERVVYGDKVINLRNRQRGGKRVWPRDGALGYLANGEIGVAVGQWKSKKEKRAPKILKVEFSSQQGYTYDFYKNDFSEEGNAALELAYALTVHKAQGSQFGLVILVLPEEHPILSRELIYTALTRHQNRVVVMHQGSRTHLKDLSALHNSETARRRTNLLTECRMQEFPQAQGSVFLQEGLIHRTSRGLAVRSKSELLIAEALGSAGVAFEYEKPLTLGGQTRYPDFTIEDEISGHSIYWEHLGMLSREEYRRAWEKKLSWYRANGIFPVEESDGGEAVLVTTTDSADSGLDMGKVSMSHQRDLEQAMEPVWSELDRLGIQPGGVNASAAEPLRPKSMDREEESDATLAETTLLEPAPPEPDKASMAPMLHSLQVPAPEISTESGPEVTARDPGIHSDEKTGHGLIGQGRPLFTSPIRAAPMPTGASPYVAFEGTAGPDPRESTLAEVAEGLCCIIETEGPMLAKRAYDLYLRGSGIHWMSGKLKKSMNRALQHAIRNRRVVKEDETGKGGLVYSTVRATAGPPVVLRARGPRDFEEIPPSELQLVARRLSRDEGFNSGSDAHLRAVLEYFDLKRLTDCAGGTRLLDVLDRSYPHVDELIERDGR